MKLFSPRLKFILINFLAAILVGCGITYFVLSKLDTYTQRGFSISVPDFSGLTPKEAADFGKHYHLRVQITDSVYDNNAKPGTVVEQYPAENSRVKEDRQISLIINASNPEKIAVPNLYNSAYRQTIQTLQSKGFKLKGIEYAPSEFKNLVLEVRYNGEKMVPGTLLPKGAALTVVLGSGNGANSVYVPKVIGKPLWEAINVINQGYLNIGEIILDDSIDKNTDRNFAIVYQQRPGGNYQVRAGTPVNLYITVQKEKIAALDSLVVIP